MTGDGDDVNVCIAAIPISQFKYHIYVYALYIIWGYCIYIMMYLYILYDIIIYYPLVRPAHCDFQAKK